MHCVLDYESAATEGVGVESPRRSVELSPCMAIVIHCAWSSAGPEGAEHDTGILSSLFVKSVL